MKPVQIIQINPGTEDELGTWVRMSPSGHLQIGWGSADSKHFTKKPQIELDAEDCRGLARFLAEHYPLEMLAATPKDD